MSVPDEIWLDYENSHGVFSSRPPDRASAHYLRATPELLALIDAAKNVRRSVLEFYGAPDHGEAVENILAAALAFARKETDPVVEVIATTAP
jgi:hypothetical protein